MEQIFLKGRCKFYTRRKSDKPQLIYAYINLLNNRFVISTGVKVKPTQFSVKKQLAQESNLLTTLDNYNNNIVNKELKAFKERFNLFLNFLMENPDKISYIQEEIYNFVTMKKKKQTANKINESLEFILMEQIDYEVKHDIISEGRVANKESGVKNFISFLSKKGIPLIWESMNLQTYNSYAEYLLTEKNAKGKILNISTINSYLSTIKSLVNGICNRELQTEVDTRKWKRERTKITTEDRKTSNYVFSDEQLDKIKNLEVSGVSAVVRDLFVFACNTGQRPGDCVKLIKSHTRLNSNGFQVIRHIPNKTKKTGIPSIIPLFDVELVDGIIEKFQNEPSYIDYLNKTTSRRNYLNSIHIKKIFKAAGINDEFVKIVQRGHKIEQEETNQTESSHVYLARHYYVTLCAKNHVPLQIVIKITGHSSTKMVEDVYSHLNEQEQADLVTSNEAIQKMGGMESEKDNDNVIDAIDELKENLTELIIRQGRPNPIQQIIEQNRPNISTEILFNRNLEDWTKKKNRKE